MPAVHCKISFQKQTQVKVNPTHLLKVLQYRNLISASKHASPGYLNKLRIHDTFLHHYEKPLNPRDRPKPEDEQTETHHAVQTAEARASEAAGKRTKTSSRTSAAPLPQGDCSAFLVFVSAFIFTFPLAKCSMTWKKSRPNWPKWP